MPKPILEPLNKPEIKNGFREQSIKSNKIVLQPMSQIKDSVPPLPKPTLIKINIRELVDTIKPIMAHPTDPKTPLIIDRSNRVDIFFQYSGDFNGIFVEAKKYVVEALITKKMSLSDCMEELRQLLVKALKFGKILVIRMSDSAADFLNKFNLHDCFPVNDLFIESGRRFFLPEFYNKVVRQADMEHDQFRVKPGFGVVITTSFQLEDYEEFLQKSIPLKYVVPIYVEPPPPNDMRPSQ